MKYREIENILTVYELNEIFELNELTEADILLYLVEQKIITLPNPKGLDFDDD